MAASFFGDSNQPLFGFYHAPRAARGRDLGVLLCGPAPQEYMRSHWAFRKLAEMLARAGLHVFRFDYFGTGDSAGDSAAGTLDIWRSNVATAAQELRDISSVNKIAAVGLRLGAALAATSTTRFQDLILWEPVVSGAKYLSQLEAVQQMLLDLNPRPAWSLRDRPPELLGHPLPRAHEEELRAFNLLRSAVPHASRATVMSSEPDKLFEELASTWSAAGLSTDARVIRDEAEEGREAGLQAALLSNTMLHAIVSRLL